MGNVASFLAGVIIGAVALGVTAYLTDKSNSTAYKKQAESDAENTDENGMEDMAENAVS